MKRINAIVVVGLMAGLMMLASCKKENITEVIKHRSLPGTFSVSDTLKVHFSPGNLQYQASTNTWRFAEHQYDYVGDDNSNISSTYSGWIDLFYWGTGNHPTESLDCYSESYSEWGSNAISNGGNITNLWRTLTIAEWEYLLEERTNASDKLGTGNIAGVGGLIILPDSWTLPSGCSFTAGFASRYNDWTRNSYTLAQWSQMEAAGAVFLPAAGGRFLTDVVDVGEGGKYWSSSGYSGYNHSYYYIFFDRNFFSVWGEVVQRSFGYGFSVRLVLDEIRIRTSFDS